MTGDDATSADMERLRTRQLWSAFAAERSGLGRGLVASVALAVVVLLGMFVAGVVTATAEQEEETTPSTVAPPVATSAPPSTPRTDATTTVPAITTPSEAVVFVASEDEWTETGLDVAVGTTIRIAANGIIAHHVGDPATEVGPAGDLRPELAPANRQVDGVPLDGPHAGLIGRIGEGAPFIVGAELEMPAETSGRLVLGVNDNNLSDNDGEFEVTVALARG